MLLRYESSLTEIYYILSQTTEQVTSSFWLDTDLIRKRDKTDFIIKHLKYLKTQYSYIKLEKKDSAQLEHIFHQYISKKKKKATTEL